VIYTGTVVGVFHRHENKKKRMHMNVVHRGFVLDHRYFCTSFMQNACVSQHTEKKYHMKKYNLFTLQDSR
jgi:hypothetical protein